MTDENVFADTEEREELLKQLGNMENSEMCYDLICKYYPDWLLGYFDRYSTDYPTLSENWIKICKMVKTEPKKILIVASLNFDKNHNFQQKLCDFLMKYGYIIRREGEFIGCSTCGLAIPCIELWGNLKYRNLPCPEIWDNKCTTC